MKSSRMTEEARKERRERILFNRQKTNENHQFTGVPFRVKGKVYPRQSTRQAMRYANG